jgi:hypothetical protein
MFSILFISNVSADWTIVYETGSWDEITLNHFRDDWKASYTYGRKDFQTNITNFSGLYSQIYFSYLDTVKTDWWVEGAEKAFHLWFNVTDNLGNSILLNVGFWDQFRLWGAIWKRECGGYVGINETEFNPAYYHTYLYDLYPETVETYLWFNRSANRVYWKILCWKDSTPFILTEMNPEWNETFVQIGEDAFKNVTITIIYAHEGWGKLNGYHNFEIKTETYEPSPPSGLNPVSGEPILFLEGLQNFFRKILPSWLQAWLASFNQWFAWLFGIIGIVWGAVSMSFPFIPVIILFWFVDAMFTSMNEGNLHPIGNVFMTMYDIIRAIIQTLVNIANTIWSIIKFW